MTSHFGPLVSCGMSCLSVTSWSQRRHFIVRVKYFSVVSAFYMGQQTSSLSKSSHPPFLTKVSVLKSSIIVGFSPFFSGLCSCGLVAAASLPPVVVDCHNTIACAQCHPVQSVHLPDPFSVLLTAQYGVFNVEYTKQM